MSDEPMITLEQLKALRKKDIKGVPYLACLCDKLLSVKDYQRKWYSGDHGKPGVNYHEILCEDCRKEFHGMPRIVCIGCRGLMGFIKPGKQATGFVFERNKHYHILECPKCNGQIRSTPVIEHENFCKENGIPTKTNWDLLKEIDQKILHNQREADKLRAEFN